MRDVILYMILVINMLSMVAMMAGILMHSGKGGGLSDMFGGGGGAALGSDSAERNLNRITFVFALVVHSAWSRWASCWCTTRPFTGIRSSSAPWRTVQPFR